MATKNKNNNGNKKADKAVYDGSILFDGNMVVKTHGGRKHLLRVDNMGVELKHADPNKEVIIMMHGNEGYCELATGFVENREDWGDKGWFGLYPNDEKKRCNLYDYSELVAWGYVDGGLNDSRRFYSCHCTPEQEAELERKRKEHGIVLGGEQPLKVEQEKKDDEYDGIRIKFQVVDGSVGIQMEVTKNRLNDYLVAAEEYLKDCLSDFVDFNKKHPGITEMHFLTKPTEWEC